MSLVIVGRKNTLLRREARKEIKRGKSLFCHLLHLHESQKTEVQTKQTVMFIH